MTDLIGTILLDAFWSALAAIGFAMLFNVPRRTVLACALTGAAGHAFRTLLMHFGMNIIPATLAGATVIGFVAEYCSRRWHAPANVFTVSGAIPMVPGSYAYRAMLGAILMQSLQSGMVLLGIDSPLQSIVVGTVLVIAVWLDTVYRKRV